MADELLTGKYKQEDTSDTGRLSGDNPFGDSKFTDRNWALLNVLRRVAEEQEHSLAQVALAWVSTRTGVALTLVGAMSDEQLQSNVAALNVELTTTQIAALNEAGATEPGFTDMLASTPVRQMIFGGSNVKNWSELQS